jgi:hypothetical protein
LLLNVPGRARETEDSTLDETSPGRRPGKLKKKAYGTLRVRVPQELVDRVHAYASLHNMTVASLIRESIEWRITEIKEGVHPPELPPREGARPPGTRR